MFTGIIHTIGTLQEVTHGDGHATFLIDAKDIAKKVSLGSSVAVNGVCLTVTQKDEALLTFDVMEETVKKTALGTYTKGMHVNLEPALRVGDELGGHFVYGHVNCIGTIVEREEHEASLLLSLQLQEGYMAYMIQEGSITIDGVSLTIAEVRGTTVSVSLVAYTRRHTTLGTKQPGDTVHIEVDMMAKYAERLLKTYVC